MFQFPGFASATYGFSDGYRTNAVGFPIRRSWDRRLLAPPPSISQRATSFIASQRQGIHQMPFVTCSTSQNAPHSSDRPALPHATMGNEPFADASTHHRAHPCAPKARSTVPSGIAQRRSFLLVTRSPDTTPYDDKHHEEPTRRYRINVPRIRGALHHLEARRHRQPGSLGEQGWWARADSNGRPHPYQGCALTD